MKKLFSFVFMFLVLGNAFASDDGEYPFRDDPAVPTYETDLHHAANVEFGVMISENAPNICSWTPEGESLLTLDFICKYVPTRPAELGETGALLSGVRFIECTSIPSGLFGTTITCPRGDEEDAPADTTEE